MPSFETTHRVAFTPAQMLDLVADVERYPEFFPLCEALTVRSRSTDAEGRSQLVADMTIGYKAIRETIRSRVTIDRETMAVRADLVSGPFRKLENRWSFEPAPGGCDVKFGLAYEFSSFLLQMVVGAVFDQAFRHCTGAFEARAQQIYGAGGNLPATRGSLA